MAIVAMCLWVVQYFLDHQPASATESRATMIALDRGIVDNSDVFDEFLAPPDQPIPGLIFVTTPTNTPAYSVDFPATVTPTGTYGGFDVPGGFSAPTYAGESALVTPYCYIGERCENVIEPTGEFEYMNLPPVLIVPTNTPHWFITLEPLWERTEEAPFPDRGSSRYFYARRGGLRGGYEG